MAHEKNTPTPSEIQELNKKVVITVGGEPVATMDRNDFFTKTQCSRAKRMAIDILCKQLQILADESEKVRVYTDDLCELTRAMTTLISQIALLSEHDDLQSIF